MKKRIFWLAVLVATVPSVAFANPSVPPPGLTIGALVTITIAFGLEIGVATIYLTLVGMAPKRVFFTLCVVNLLTYTLVLLPGEELGFPIVILEFAILCIEALAIKLMAFHFFFHGGRFDGLKWRHAFGAALLGNLTSYLAGLAMFVEGADMSNPARDWCGTKLT